MLIPKRKQPGFFLSPAFSSSHSLNGYFSETSENLSATGKCFPKLRKTSMRRKSASRNFGKSQCGGKVLPETSESPNAAEKCFPKLRKPPMRRKSASRNFGKSQRDGKVLPETSGNPSATGKAFICIKNGLPANLYSKDSFLQGGRLHSQGLSSMSAESDGQRPDLLLRHINIRHRRLPVIYNLKLRPGYD